MKRCLHAAILICMVAEPLGSDSGESDFWVNHLDQGQASADSAQPSASDRNWIRLVQNILSVRVCQYWAIPEELSKVIVG